jgi:sugar transferase (PEP-CTERM/EpsH1 system associated)
MARTIRILHVLHTFSTGGLENGVVNIINGSPKHFEHELCFLHRAGEFLGRIGRPVTYHEMHKRPGNDPRFVLRLREFFRRRQVDIIHTRNWGAFDGVLAACLLRKPVLIHSEHGRDIGDPAGMSRRRNLARRAMAFRASKFVSVSRDLYSWLKGTVHIPEEKLVLIPNGVDTSRFRPGRDLAMRAELNIGDDEFVVGAVGRLDPIKNYPGLIAAVRRLNSNGRKVRLVIAGDGPERRRIEELLQPTITPQPLLLGSRSDVGSLYRMLDVFVLNSFAEGMSNTLLEAMASGLPIVCTAVGGNTELVTHGENGVLITPGDDASLAEAIESYISSPETRTAHGYSACRFVTQNLSLERMIQRYAALYESAA